MKALQRSTRGRPWRAADTLISWYHKVSKIKDLPCLRLRPAGGSYVPFLPCRIHVNKLNSTQIFHVWIGCRISAAPSTGLVALSDRNAIPIQTSNFGRVESNSYIMLIYWACVNLVTPKKTKKLGHYSPNELPEHIATHTAAFSSFFHPVLLTDYFFVKFKCFVSQYLRLLYKNIFRCPAYPTVLILN